MRGFYRSNIDCGGWGKLWGLGEKEFFAELRRTLVWKCFWGLSYHLHNENSFWQRYFVIDCLNFRELKIRYTLDSSKTPARNTRNIVLNDQRGTCCINLGEVWAFGSREKSIYTPKFSRNINNLSPIYKEYSWNDLCKLHKQAKERRIEKETYDEYAAQVLSTIRGMPIDLIDKTIASLPKRMSAFIATKGDRTKYWLVQVILASFNFSHK